MMMLSQAPPMWVIVQGACFLNSQALFLCESTFPFSHLQMVSYILIVQYLEENLPARARWVDDEDVFGQNK